MAKNTSFSPKPTFHGNPSSPVWVAVCSKGIGHEKTIPFLLQVLNSALAFDFTLVFTCVESTLELIFCLPVFSHLPYISLGVHFVFTRIRKNCVAIDHGEKHLFLLCLHKQRPISQPAQQGIGQYLFNPQLSEHFIVSSSARLTN